MASLRPVSRLLPRLTSNIRPSLQTPQTIRPSVLSLSQHNHLSTTRPFLRSDDNFGHTGRRQPTTSTTSPSTNNNNNTTSTPTPTSPLSSGIPPSTIYNFTDIESISSNLSSYPNRILIDVREPNELLDLGRIPGAVNLPIKTSPDSFFLSPEDFEDKYGFERPDEDKEVIFYCKAGVRSKAAARLAGQAGFGGKVGEFPGSFDEWLAKGGKVQRE